LQIASHFTAALFFVRQSRFQAFSKRGAWCGSLAATRKVMLQGQKKQQLHIFVFH